MIFGSRSGAMYRARIHVAIPDRWTVDARLVRAVAAWAGAAIIRPAKS